MVSLLSSKIGGLKGFAPIPSSGELPCEGKLRRRYSHRVGFQISLRFCVLRKEGFYSGRSANPPAGEITLLFLSSQSAQIPRPSRRQWLAPYSSTQANSHQHKTRIAQLFRPCRGKSKRADFSSNRRVCLSHSLTSPPPMMACRLRFLGGGVLSARKCSGSVGSWVGGCCCKNCR